MPRTIIALSTFRSPRRAAVLGGVGAVVMACTNPWEMCGCPPARSHAIASGTVRTAAGAPVAGASVSPRLLSGSCAADFIQVADHYTVEGRLPLPTDASGQFEMRFYSMSSANQCVRFVAHRTPADSAFVDVPDFRFRGESETPPRSQVDIVFP